MNFLLHFNTAANRTDVAQDNAERIDRSRAFALNPSLVAGVATVDAGSPAAGKRVLGELWTDAYCATWRCTLAGTPGTWIQIAPAVVEADPVGVPDGYVIERVAEKLKRYYWDEGGTAWVAV